MTDEYARFIRKDAIAAEKALFELRAALTGTGIAKYDRQAKAIEKMQDRCIDIIIDINNYLRED